VKILDKSKDKKKTAAPIEAADEPYPVRDPADYD